MGWVAEEQLERARQIPVLEYVCQYESDNLKLVGKEYRLHDHKSLAVGENGWYWHSRNFGSWSALDFLTDVRGYSLVEAVCFLLDENPQEHSGQMNTATQSSAKKTKPASLPMSNYSDPTKQIPFVLPLRNKNNNRIIAYLQSRDIDRDLIMDCIERGILFESKYYHNCVFLGKDEYGKARFAAMRSITTRFMRDVDGSNKKYGFVLPPINPHSCTVACYEAPIDCLSHQTLCKHGYIPHFDGWRLSLGGTSTLALEHFLQRHPNITHCIICTDADRAGDMVAGKIAAIAGITTERPPPLYGSDWNDTLQTIKKAERTQSKVRNSRQI